jgi:hypothetical protein
VPQPRRAGCRFQTRQGERPLPPAAVATVLPRDWQPRPRPALSRPTRQARLRLLEGQLPREEWRLIQRGGRLAGGDAVALPGSLVPRQPGARKAPAPDRWLPRRKEAFALPDGDFAMRGCPRRARLRREARRRSAVSPAACAASATGIRRSAEAAKGAFFCQETQPPIGGACSMRHRMRRRWARSGIASEHRTVGRNRGPDPEKARSPGGPVPRDDPSSS